jgi:hypothetical protein
MHRRDFLRQLLGATATAMVAPRVVYAFAPPGGWALRNGVYTFANGRYTLYGGSRQLGKSIVFKELRRAPVVDAALVRRALVTRAASEWFFEEGEV